MKSFNIFILIGLCFFCIGSYAGKYPYPEEAHNLTLKIYEMLVSEGVCKARNNCDGKEFAFREGTAEKIYISVFRNNVLRPSIISKIITLCTEEYYLHNQKMTINLKIYNETIQERNAWFSGVKPFINLTLKGEK